MFASPTSPNVKIIDFGLSKKYGKNEILNQTVGTVYTMAPEVIKGNGYTEQCDVWSIGVLGFMLCSSSLPFFGKSRQRVVKKIMNGEFGFKGRRWKDISEEAKDFCSELLVHDVNARPDCVESLKHKWFHTGQEHEQLPRGSSHSVVHRDGTTGQVVSSVVMDRVQATIQMFSGYTKLKKLALYVIAHKSTADEIGFLQQLFQNRFDVEKDGVITIDEFKDALKVYSYTEDELCIMFNAVDIDGGNNISYSEFLAATIEAHGTIEEDRIAEAFDRLDSDDDGYITVKNLKSFLGQDISLDFIDGIIDEVDVTNDHRVDYDEFLGLWDGSFDEELERTLSIVQQKRLVSESSAELPLYDEGENGEFLEKDNSDDGDDNGDDDDGYGDGGSHESDPLPPGASKFYFEQEKEKSMRGAWI
jgi:calcium-dependent protein kinase